MARIVVGIGLGAALALTGCSKSDEPPQAARTQEQPETRETVQEEAQGGSQEEPTIGAEAPAPPQEEPQPAEEPEADTCWSQVSDVLDGTDLIRLPDSKPVSFERERAAGRYHAEQGGTRLTLQVRTTDDGVHVKRRHREPGLGPHSAEYTLTRITQEGAASDDCQVFLRQTEEGVLLLETDSGVESIPASYWAHYIRR